MGSTRRSAVWPTDYCCWAMSSPVEQDEAWVLVSTQTRQPKERLVVISQGADAKNFDEKGSFLEQRGTQNTAEQNSEL